MQMVARSEGQRLRTILSQFSSIPALLKDTVSRGLMNSLVLNFEEATPSGSNVKFSYTPSYRRILDKSIELCLEKSDSPDKSKLQPIVIKELHQQWFIRVAMGEGLSVTQSSLTKIKSSVDSGDSIRSLTAGKTPKSIKRK